MKSDDELSAMLRSLPHEVEPLQDAWPAIASRAFVKPRWHERAIWKAAAAVLIFVVGSITGNAWASRSRFVAAAPMVEQNPASLEPLALAAEVQHTGTQYLVALARLQEARDDAEIRQGYEVALTTMSSAASELASLRVIGPASDSLLAAIASARVLAASRVIALTKRSGP